MFGEVAAEQSGTEPDREHDRGHERGEARVLSAPNITLNNGQAGYIVVGNSFDYISTFEVEDSVLIPEIETATEAISLNVRPIVSADRRYVFLELAPTISSVDLTNTASFQTFVGQPGGGDGGSASGDTVTNTMILPNYTQQLLETTVGIPDRGMVIVGGLTRSTRTQDEGGMPILDKIPFFKRLFSAEGESMDRTTLFVIARPRVIMLDEEDNRMD